MSDLYQERYEEKLKNIENSNQGKVCKFRMSYIEPWEEEEAIARIEEMIGERPHMCGPKILVAPYTPSRDITHLEKDGKRISIAIPDSVSAHDKHLFVVGLVLSMGPEAYRGWRFQESTFMRIARFFFGKWMKPSYLSPRCKVGDWVVYPANEGARYVWRDINVRCIDDDKVFQVVQDPSEVCRD